MRWTLRCIKRSWLVTTSAVSISYFTLTFTSIATKGTSGHLMKASSVRRRSKAQIIEDKIKEAEKLKSVEKKLEDW